jgi:type IV pilus assembly protein PilX
MMSRLSFNRELVWRSQGGFVLITALVFMVLMTLLALTVANSTTSEERMARNFRDRDMAFSAAEAALRDAKLHVTGSWQWPYSPVELLDFASDCTNGLCESIYTSRVATPIDSIDFYSGATPGSSARNLGAVTGTPAISGVANPPRYMVEVVCSNRKKNEECIKVFRITVQAQGRNTATRVVLQEIFRPAQEIK